MKKILFATAILAFGAAHAAYAGAGYQPVVTVLPQSNVTGSTIVVATATAPGTITVSSTTATRLDAAANALLLAGLDATYQRAEVSVQNTGSANLYIGFGASVSMTAGFIVVPGDVWTFKIGQTIQL